MGQHPFIIKGLEGIVEYLKPFLPKLLGGQDESIFGNVGYLAGIKDCLGVPNGVIRDLGENPVFFLDCSAVIDFEKDFHDKSLGCGKSNEIPRDCHQYLETLSHTGRFIFPDYMRRELERHRYCNIGKRREVCDKTLDATYKINESSKKVLSNLKSKLDGERVRLDVYLAANECFKDNYKKGVIDKISDNDRNLIVDAIYARNSEINGKAITSSVIFSEDQHILDMICFLKRPENKGDYDCGLKGYSHRGGKDGRYDIH